MIEKQKEQEFLFRKVIFLAMLEHIFFTFKGGKRYIKMRVENLTLLGELGSLLHCFIQSFQYFNLHQAFFHISLKRLKGQNRLNEYIRLSKYILTNFLPLKAIEITASTFLGFLEASEPT